VKGAWDIVACGCQLTWDQSLLVSLPTKFANEMQSWEISAMDDVLQRGFIQNPCVCDLIWISWCWNKFRVLIFTLQIPQRT
jgi:hypothetical protein